MSNLRAKFASWEAVTLGAVCVFKGGSGFKESFQGTESGEHPFIKVSDLNLPGNEKYVLHSNNWVSAAELKLLKATLQPIGATVFAKVGAALKLNRRRVLVRPTVIDNNMMAAIPDETHLNREYLYYFLLGEDLGRFSQESAVPSINQGHLESILIPLPPLAEQRKIAEILRTWDEAIETAEAELKAKQERKRGLIQRLLTPCPEGTGTVSSRNNQASYCVLGSLVTKIEGGGTPSKEVPDFWDGDIPLLTIKDLPNARLGVTVDRITAKGLKSSSSKIVPAGIPVIATRMDVGKVVRCPVPVAINQDLRAIYPDPAKVDVDYIVQVLPTLEREFRRYSCGSTVMGIGIDDLKSVKIYLPSLVEQCKIADILKREDLDEELINKRIAFLRTQKRGLMQKLLTGEVRVAA
jgi:type I restriction enzyme S subunit